MDIKHTEQLISCRKMMPQLKTLQDLYIDCPELMAILQEDTEMFLCQEESQMPDQNDDRHCRKKLIAHWELENGKLICKWLVKDEL